MERARHIRLRAAAAALLPAVALAGCGGSGSGARPGGSGQGAGSRSTPSNTVLSGAPRTLGVAPAHPAPSSELTFTFTAPATTGVRGSHVISYSLSLTGPVRPGCVGAHEAGGSSVQRGARGQITLGPAELHAPWCAGRYSARILELRSAHCTGTALCPQYVSVVALVARTTFTIRQV